MSVVEFPKMVKVVPEGVRGVAAIEHFEITKFNAQMLAIRDRQYYVTEGRYARLKVNGQVFMTAKGRTRD